MPIYEYLCESCGKVNERIQKMNDPPPRTCDECGSRKLAKLVSRSAFQLKGGGWYSDLYSSRKKESPPAEGGDAAPKGDAAPAATAEKPTKAEKAEKVAKAGKETPAPKPSAPKAADGSGSGKKAG